MKPNRRDADPTSRLGGHLLELAGEHDRAALSVTAASLAHSDNLTERDGYGAVKDDSGLWCMYPILRSEYTP